MTIETVVVPASGTACAAVDAAAVDAGVVDAGVVDVSLVDTGVVDLGAVAAGAIDAGAIDAGAIDAAVVDVGLVDAGTVEAAAADLGAVGTGDVDAVAADTTARASRGAAAPLAMDAGMEGDGLAACSLKGVANGESSSTEAECSVRSTRGNPGGTCARLERHFQAVNETSAKAPPIKLHRAPLDSGGSTASVASGCASDAIGVFAAEAG